MWTARVVEADEFNIAKIEALNLQRERKRLDDQRMVVYRAAVRHAAAVSGVIHSASVDQILQEEEYRRQKELTDTLKRVEFERKVALGDLNSALSGIDSLVDNKALSEKALINVTHQLKMSQAQEEVYRKENSALKTKNAELMKLNDDLNVEIDALRSKLSDTVNARDAAQAELSSKKGELEQLILADGATMRNDIDALRTLRKENAANISRIEALEAEVQKGRAANLSLVSEIAASKAEAASMAAELFQSAEKEDAARGYIESLQEQLASTLRMLDESLALANLGTGKVDRDSVMKSDAFNHSSSQRLHALNGGDRRSRVDYGDADDISVVSSNSFDVPPRGISRVGSSSSARKEPVSYRRTHQS
jgi:hypothetical protein